MQNTLIIGAGPAGLAVAGRLHKMGIPYLILEKTHQIASAWHNHYERLCLHTVKEHSNLPHLPLPDHYPTYASRTDMITYWESYAAEMQIPVSFGQEVQRIRKKDNYWETTTATGSYQSQNVVLATGYNRVPYMPRWTGQERFQGTVIHSRDYRNATPFTGKKVLVIGIGNTGAELALDLYENGAFPAIAVRSPVNFIKRDIGGRPAQKTAILLGKLPNTVYDFIARKVQQWTIGDLRAYGITTPPYAPSEGLRRFGKVPVIDIGTLDLIKQQKINIHPDIQAFTNTGVLFKNGEEHPFDAIIVCTGYRAQVEDFLEQPAFLLNERGYPRHLWFDEPAWHGLYFCGFSVPLSGILRNIKMDSEKIANRIHRSR